MPKNAMPELDGSSEAPNLNDQFLCDYLDDMLHEPVVDVPQPKTVKATSIIIKDDTIPPSNTRVVEPEPIVAVVSSVVALEADVVISESTPTAPPNVTTNEVVRPEWSLQRFQCLLFTVAGLKLAVPLVSLGSIYRIDKKFNNLPGQDEWFLGILRGPAGNIRVINTAYCVMPERYEATSRDSLQFVISLQGYDWGLACHEVANAITLEPGDVSWRSRKGTRPWLAGTVKEHMCALLDTDGFNSLITKGVD